MKSKKENKTVLIVAAHPDDEILGCGATVARLVKEGWKAATLILGEGKTARDERRRVEKHTKEMTDLRKEAVKANKVVGINNVIFEQFPDNRFDSVALLDVIKVVEKVKNDVQPSLVFTHFEHDLNIDHRVTYQAVLTATRPMAGESVRTIYSFENISSTEWAYPLRFSPNVFFDVTKTIELKIKSLACYASEMRGFPHPRSLEGARLAAKTWGIKTGVSSAEAFQCVRSLQ